MTVLYLVPPKILTFKYDDTWLYKYVLSRKDCVQLMMYICIFSDLWLLQLLATHLVVVVTD